MLKAGDTGQVIASFADIHERPKDLQNIKRRDSQLLFGERFQIEKTEGAWAFGTSENDGYQGYVDLKFLKDARETTHMICALLTHIYPAPDYKMRPMMALSYKSEIICTSRKENGFVEISGGGWVAENHIALPGSQKDFVGASIKFLGMPYLYGGRSALGIDCSGLVQIALQSCGIKALRDSDQQQDIGEPVEPRDIQRGDLVFFSGHVGIMISQSEILNATSRTMDVRIEKLEMLEEFYKGVTAIRRV